MELILASSSPQRRQLLDRFGASYRVVAPEIDEREQGLPDEIAIYNSEAKARAVSERIGNDLPILACDTVVGLAQQPLGKPATAGQAFDYLKLLSGKWHYVVSSLTLIAEDGSLTTETTKTEVKFRTLTDSIIQRYVELGEWQGRAGGYAVQECGALLIEQIVGDYSNVVGLPLVSVDRLLPGLLL